MILWGPPGCGKTTIARLLAERTDLAFEPLSATFSGVADLRNVFQAAQRRRELGQGTLLFVDERNEVDIIAGDQLRSAHGKGVRAVLHAAFTIALAQYCFDRDLPHPGFVVLDSPLVTYRPPDQSTSTDNEPPEGVVRAFYRDIQDHFDGQIIVMENTDPLDPLGPDALDIRFTKHVDVGRYGFMPAVIEGRAVNSLVIES